MDDHTEITDITANTVLAWKAVSLDAQFKDSYEVKISTTGAATTDFTKTLFTKAGENGEITDRSLSLKDYAGKPFVWFSETFQMTNFDSPLMTFWF